MTHTHHNTGDAEMKKELLRLAAEAKAKGDTKMVDHVLREILHRYPEMLHEFTISQLRVR